MKETTANVQKSKGGKGAMKFKKITYLFLVVAILASSLMIPAGQVSAATTVLRVGGSTTISPLATVMEPIFEAANPGIDVSIQEGGSGAGRDGVLAGTLDVGMMSRDLTADEKKQYPFLIPITIGKDAICVIASAQNANIVSNLTTAQVMNIFSKSATSPITNWSQLGGDNAPIEIHTRISTSGTLAAFKELALNNTEYVDVTNPAFVHDSNEQMAAAVASSKYAIGFCSLGVLSSSAGAKAFSINNVPATVDNAKAGTYPYVRPLNFVTKRDAVGNALKWLYAFLSPEGQNIVDGKSYLKVNEHSTLTVKVDSQILSATQQIASELSTGTALDMPINVTTFTNQETALQEVANGTTEAVIIHGALSQAWYDNGLRARLVAEGTDASQYNYITKGFGTVDALGAQELLRQNMLNPRGQKIIEKFGLVRAWIFGDCTNDGKVDTADFGNIRAYILGKITSMKNPSWLFSADVNGDGRVDTGDYGTVKAYLLGKISAFPAVNKYNPYYPPMP